MWRISFSNLLLRSITDETLIVETLERESYTNQNTMSTYTEKQKQIIRKYYFDDLSCFHQTHKMLMAVHYFGGAYYLGRFQTLTDTHIQISKEVLLEQVQRRIFGGTEVIFKDELAEMWFKNLDITQFESYHKEQYDWNTRTKSLNTSETHWRMKSEYLELMPTCLFDLEA